MAPAVVPEDIGLGPCVVPALRAFFFFFFEDDLVGFTTAADWGGPPLRVTLFGGILKDLPPPHSTRDLRNSLICQFA